jgi:hypothetical protein
MIDRNPFTTGVCRRPLIVFDGLLAAAAGITEIRAADLSSFTANFESLNPTSPPC